MNDQAARIKPVIVVLPAEIDVTNSDGVYQQLLAALASGVGTVIADMTSTSFCDSSGVHAIMSAHEQATSAGHRAAAGGVADRLGAPRAAADRGGRLSCRCTQAFRRRWPNWA